MASITIGWMGLVPLYLRQAMRALCLTPGVGEDVDATVAATMYSDWPPDGTGQAFQGRRLVAPGRDMGKWEVA